MGRRLRRWRKRVEWYLAEPVPVTRARPGQRVLLKDGSVHVIESTREIPFPPVVHVTFSNLGGQMRTGVSYNRHTMLRLAPALRRVSR